MFNQYINKMMIKKRRVRSPEVRMFTLTKPQKTMTKFRVNKKYSKSTRSASYYQRKSTVPNWKSKKSMKLLQRKPSIDFERKLQELETVGNFISKKEMELRATDVPKKIIPKKNNIIF